MATKEMLPMSLGKSDEPEVGVTGGASSSGKPRNFLFSKVDELFTQPGLVTATEPGFYGEGVPKILSYAGKDVRSILAPFFLSDLTVCNSWQMWANHSVMVMYALTLMLIIGYTCFPDGHMGDQDACKDGYNLNVCQLNETLEDAKDEYRFLVAFILAGYVGMSVNIWYLRRKNYASLCGNVRNTLLNVSSWIQLDKDNDELMEDRRSMNRWLIMGMELAVLKSRGCMDSEEGKAYLTDIGLLKKGEWEAMVHNDRHTSCFWWTQCMVVGLAKEGFVSQEGAEIVALCISSLRGQANDVQSSLDRDKPYSYVVLCGMLVKMNVLIMSTWKGVQWAIWLYAFGGPDLCNQSKFWLDIFVLFTWNVSYTALYDLGYLLENPFKNRTIDVAHEVIIKGLRTLGDNLMNGEDPLTGVNRLAPRLQVKSTRTKTA